MAGTVSRVLSWLRLCVLLSIGACACRPYHVYWGDVHGHTMRSDGKGTVSEYFTYARDTAQLDFAIVTDHDFGNGPPWRMPEEVWRRTQETADAFTRDGEFVAIAGYEWTSQPKYWSGVTQGPSEHLFDGPPRYFNHKNVYFPAAVPHLFSAKDRATFTPDLLADAVAPLGGLIQNNHPDAGPGGRDQWDYSRAHESVIANTEMGADVVRYKGVEYRPRTEATVRAFLDQGRRTGFVKGTDTHEGHPAARTAVLARELTRAGIFEALRARRTYAVSYARILLECRIQGHWMGEDVALRGPPRLSLRVRGTAPLEKVEIIRDGKVVHTVRPARARLELSWVDRDFPGRSYYYVRVTQTDRDREGNPCRAWSSPIWVTRP